MSDFRGDSAEILWILVVLFRRGVGVLLGLPPTCVSLSVADSSTWRVVLPGHRRAASPGREAAAATAVEVILDGLVGHFPPWMKRGLRGNEEAGAPAPAFSSSKRQQQLPSRWLDPAKFRSHRRSNEKGVRSGNRTPWRFRASAGRGFPALCRRPWPFERGTGDGHSKRTSGLPGTSLY
jgi:hypothetical protein